MTSKLWKDYNAKNAYDGYFTADNKLRKHAKIISGILEKYAYFSKIPDIIFACFLSLLSAVK